SGVCSAPGSAPTSRIRKTCCPCRRVAQWAATRSASDRARRALDLSAHRARGPILAFRHR
ncbi:hypothetical protein ABTF54_20225, partial [Acinetobacter baumannii]